MQVCISQKIESGEKVSRVFFNVLKATRTPGNDLVLTFIDGKGYEQKYDYSIVEIDYAIILEDAEIYTFNSEED